MALLRNAQNVPVAVDTQVMISFADDPKIGKGAGLFGDDWHTVGILADGSSITNSKDTDEVEIKGLHYGTLRTKRTPGKETLEFEVIEDNDITRRIANPSEKNGVRFNDGKQLAAHVAVVYVDESADGNSGKCEIIATRYKAHLYMEEVVRGGEDVEGKTVTVDITKGSAKDTWDVARFKIEGDELVQVKPIRFVDDSEIQNENVVDAKGNIVKGEDTTFPFSEADKKVAGGEGAVDPGNETVEDKPSGEDTNPNPNPKPKPSAGDNNTEEATS